MSIPGYDAWKLATPPEYEEEHCCEKCGGPLTKDAWPFTTWFCERCDDFVPDYYRDDDR
ncbi:MAG TPA: hypothetical protein VIY51_01805 [Xanthobacteraceae bacterium]